MKKMLLLLTCLIPAIFCQAQTRQVLGRVTDAEGAPLRGVNVLVAETKKRAVTDVDGNFKIEGGASGNVTLIITSTGYKDVTTTADGRTTLKVTLEKNVTAMDDVVVVGYSTVRRKDLTGSVSSVSSKQLKDVPVSSAAEALQGRLAGVQAISTEGAPGAEVVIRVRGGGSITQDNSPLYIVDGVQVDNALSVISPQDIASIDVLKDASTTAIYGARGANGVVIITTKTGRAGKTQVSYNGQFGFRKLPETMAVLSPYDFVFSIK